jgi:hypothetical protein
MFKSITMIISIPFALTALAFADPVPTTIDDFFMPGSQPLESGNIEKPTRCDNCHGGYEQPDTLVEPAFNWRGSMMSQAMRDPLFTAFLVIANQDAPESGDLCIRCHSPSGWLEGRSEPTNGSSLTRDDRESVHCDVCHRMVKPFPLGTNPYPDDSIYTADTYPQDTTYLATIDSIPGTTANGMFVVDSDASKRGPFYNAVGRHPQLYSPFHRDADICGNCHDVSNPAFTKDANGKYQPNDFGQSAPDFNPYSMMPIERTFSEWKMSEYNTAQGVYAPQFGGNLDYVSTCQDCHMRDVTGKGCDKNNAPVRDDLPLHDLTGGNTFTPLLIESVYPGEADIEALLNGIQRAIYMLENAATLELTATVQGDNYLASVDITNETGHKLPSGYPEGRRIWINMKAFDMNDNLIYESGAYDFDTGELTHDPDVKIYEIKPGISESLSQIVNIPAGPSFHFVLNDTIYKDNRIPARGFTNANYDSIGSPVVDYSYEDGQYRDETSYLLPGSTAKIAATLYYQTTSREFVEFLRDENHTNNQGNEIYDLWVTFDKCPPVVMQTDTILVDPLEPPVVLIDMIPDNPPVIVPAGGYFTFTGILINTTNQSQTTDVWIMLNVPGYGIYGPLQTFNNIGLTAYDTLTVAGVRQNIPIFAPSGTYDYIAYCGDSPSNPIDSGSFGFEVIQPLTEGAGEWSIAGWFDTENVKLPASITLSNSYPNPFNASTVITYQLASDAQVKLSIYNLLGRKIADLIDTRQRAGEHEVRWDASSFASGIYFYKLTTTDQSFIRRMVLLK